MKNYKIIENRPPLTPEQLSAGMDFAKVKTGAAIAKKAIIKSLILKSMIGIVTISSAVLIYTAATNPAQTPTVQAPANPPTTIQVAPTATLDKKPDSVIVISPTAIADTPKTPKQTTTIVTVVDGKKKAKTTTTTVIVGDVTPVPEVVISPEPNVTVITPEPGSAYTYVYTNGKKSSAAAVSIISPVPPLEPLAPLDPIAPKAPKAPKTPVLKNVDASVKSCKIWHTTDFCDIPESTKFSYSINCDDCELHYVPCEDATKNPNITAVKLTLTTDKKSDFKLLSQLDNIILIKANGDTQTPAMVGLGTDRKFFDASLKVKKFEVTYSKQIDIYLFFKSPEVGDRIVIHDYTDATIEP